MSGGDSPNSDSDYSHINNLFDSTIEAEEQEEESEPELVDSALTKLITLLLIIIIAVRPDDESQ
jgi:hypothetical protein